MRRQLLLLSFFWFIAVLFSTAIGQMQANFPERYRVTVKGDMIIVGNTMVSPPGGSAIYDDTNIWNYFYQKYVDVDNDNSTFNSSSARVLDPNPGGACPRKVKKAFLYWASNDNSSAGTTDRVKFKIDNGNYQDIIGTLVTTNVNGIYVYIADVTDKLTSVAGNYTVANLQAPTRYAAGWTLFIIYEDATKPARNISLFDGIAIVNGSTSAVINIQGFKTVPSPLPVNAKIGFASLEGDVAGVGDQLKITTNKINNEVLSSPGRPSNNFFNSTATDENGINLNRTPRSKNLMGYDTGILQLENANNRILDNNSTWAKLTATTAGDVYYPFMFAFNVEVIEPTIVMNKRVYNAANQDVTGQNNIALGSTLKYEIEFQNQGNDDAKNLTITDILPPNLENSATGIYVSDSRITYNYDPNTRKLTANVPNDLVKQNGSKYKISFNVKVVPKCDTWTSPCANKIQNSASATYQGTRNPATFTPKSSNAQFSACGSTEESSTDFLVGVDFSKCTYKTSTILCQPTMNLTAAPDFDSYTWTKEGDSSFSGTGQTISINAVGTYKVTKTKAGCATMYEEFEVKPNDHEADHPLENKIKNKEISGEVYVCPSTGQKYPQVYLCGKNASVEVKLKIDNAKSFQWGKMAASCPSKQLDCPASAPSQSTCWSNDGALINGTTTQKTFSADGDYKLTVTYDGDCVATYYFRVTKDQTDLDADVVHKVCNTQGSIKAKGISGSGYKYQLKQGNTVVRAWQTSVEFKNLDPGTYMLQATLPTANTQSIVTCVYEKEVTIEQITPSLQVTATNPLCNGGLGALQIQLSYPPYFPYTYKIIKDGQVVAQQAVTTQHLAGLTVSLTAGSYTVKVENNYGCTLQQTKNITDPAALKLDLGVRHKMCDGGKIIAKVQGGTPNSNGYTLELYKNGTFVSRATTQSGLYTFTLDDGAYEVKAIDGNNCNKTATATVLQLPRPSATVTYTLYECGAKGKVVFSVPQSSVSYTYQYSLQQFLPTNGSPIIQSGREFTNLPVGASFIVQVHYTYAGETCRMNLNDITIPDLRASNDFIASAGVAELIGCGTGANANKARVSFNNVQGGRTPYLYNFGDGVWTTTSSRWMDPGTYYLSAKDAIECSRDNLKVVVPAKLTVPQFSNSNIVYNCEGKGTVSITNTQGTYTYTYSLNGGAPQTSNIFSNLNAGTYTVAITYQSATQPAATELIKEDFGVGDDTCSPNASPALSCGPNLGPTPGRYVIGSNSSVFIQSHLNWWTNANDHTNPSNRKSRMFLIDIGNVGNGDVLYSKTVNIEPNRKILYEMYVMNLEKVGWNGALPDIKIFLVNPNTNAIIDQKDYGTISRSTGPNDWRRFSGELNPGNTNRVRVEIRTKSWAGGGCDMALDDIYVFQVPKVCPDTVTHTFKIESGKEFGVDTTTEELTPAKCKGGLGQYKIKLKNMPNGQYYYAVSGFNNFNFNASTPNTDTFTWNGYAGNYTVKFRGELNNANCEIVRTFTITEPVQLQVTAANAQGDVTLGCTPKVTAAQLLSATGGTKPYTFAIYKGNVTITTIALNATATNTSFVFTQTGNYTIGVTDANGCKATTAQAYKIYEPKVLQLQPAATSPSDNNYCAVTSNNGKVTLKVVALNGANTQPGTYNNAPYTFKHNGSVVTRTYGDTYTFDNLGVATHTFEVVDKYGCSTSTQVRLNKPLTSSTGNTSAPPTLVKDITCTPGNAGRAEIALKPEGGYPPYSYKVYRTPNMGTPLEGNGGLAANTTITYYTNVPGGYVIRVADNRGCEFYSGVVTITNPIPATISATVTSATCYGENNGVVSVTINGGAAPFRIKLNSTDANWTSVTGNKHLFSNVSTGTHNMVVIDANDCQVTKPVFVAAPTQPLRGFAGVSQLVGCGDGVNKNKAKVRFTNVSGGWGDYQYKYDGGFSIYPEGWITPGTHTVTIKDKGGCEYDIRVVVPEKITEPTGTTYTIVTYDCSGKGTIRLTGVPNTYDYTYIIDGKTATGTTATITGLAPGTYTMTIKYKDGNPPASGVLMQEDFGVGDPEPYEGVNTAFFHFHDPRTHPVGSPTQYTRAAYKDYVSPNTFGAARAPYYPANLGSAWTAPFPGTTTGANNDRYLYVDMAANTYNKVFLEKEVEVDPYNLIEFDYQIRSHNGNNTIFAHPNMRIQIVDMSNNVLGAINSGAIPHDNAWHLVSSKNLGKIDPNGNRRVKIQFLNMESNSTGNDFAIDDIYVYQIPESCAQTITRTVVIPSGQEFKGSVLSVTNVDCKDNATGKTTLKVENLRGGNYTVQISPSHIARTGAGYTTPINSNTFEITQLQKGNYTITFRYTPAHSGLGSGCVVTTTLQVTEPTQIGLTATQTVPAMCSNNNVATVKLTATGGTGTGTYKYEYYDANNVLKAGPQTSNIFTGVAPGVQNKFKVIDANNCSLTITMGIADVPAKKTVSFTLEATDCYANDQQGEVKVRITDGNGNYRVKIGAGNLVSPTTNSVTHSFTGLRQGNHLVTVEDGYGCQATGTIVIYPALNYTLKTTHQGSCSGAQGKIEVTARGGDGNIRYYFKKVGGTLSGPHTSGTFPIPSFSESSQTWVVYIQSARCEKTETVTINNVSAPTGFTLQTVTPTCTGGENGSIVVGGLAQAGEPYRVEVWHPDGGVRTQTGVTNNTPYTYTNAKAGLYTVTVRDTYGCSVSRTVRVGEMPDLSTDFELKVSSNQCPAAGAPTTLTLTFSPSTTWAVNVAVADIYYRINSDNTWTRVTTNPVTFIHPSFKPGSTISITYKKTVQGGNATLCVTATKDYTVPHNLSGTTVVTNLNDPKFYGCSGANGGFTATVTIPTGEGQPPYHFSLDGNHWSAANNGANSRVWTGLVPGRTYKFYVKDNRGCTAEYDGDIYGNSYNPAIRLHLTATPACSNGAQGTLTIQFKRRASYMPGGTTNGTYKLYELPTPVPSGRQGTLVSGPTLASIGATGELILNNIGVTPGKTYYVEFSETAGCVWGSNDVEVKKLTTIQGIVSVTTTATCENDAIVEVTGLSGGGGQYTVTLEERVTGSFGSTPIAVGSNKVRVQKENVTGATAATFKYPAAPITAGVRVQVSDQYNCSPIDFGVATITVLPRPEVRTVTYSGCTNGSFKATITPTAQKLGTTTNPVMAPATEIPLYEYSIDGGDNGGTWHPSNVFSNLTAGTYPIAIKERATGCVATSSLVIYDVLEASASVKKGFDCSVPPSTPVAQIELLVTKGSTRYSYSVTGYGIGTPLTGNTFSLVPATQASRTVIDLPSAAGNMSSASVYTVTVTDLGAPTCTPTQIAVTVQPAAQSRPALSFTTYSATCHGDHSGWFSMQEVNANGANFNYSIQGPVGATVPSGTNLKTAMGAQGLKAGVYTITVTNTTSLCGSTYTITIGEPTAITFNTASITVKSFGCATGTSQLRGMAEIDVPMGAISGGTGSYTILYTDSYGGTGSGTHYALGQKAGGVVTVTVRDAAGCTTETRVTIGAYEELEAANATVTIAGALSCVSAVPVQVSVSAVSGLPLTIGDLRFAMGATAPTTHPNTWTNTTGQFNVQMDATHTFWVGHSKTGCVIRVLYRAPNVNTFKIVNPQVSNTPCKGGSEGTATFTLSNTTSGHGHQVTINPSAGTLHPAGGTLAAGTTQFWVSGLASGTYTLTVKDSTTDCAQDYVFTIEEPTVSLSATTQVRSITCAAGNNDGSIVIKDVVGGWGSYEYYIQTTPPTPSSGLWTTTSSRGNLSAGTYKVSVRDASGCQYDLNDVTLSIPTGITGILTITTENCTPGTGVLSVVSVSGGEGANYTYQLYKDGAAYSQPQASNIFGSLGSGSYQVVVRDSWGCSATLTAVSLYEPVAGTMATIMKQVTCAPGVTGATISVTHLGGSGNVEYKLYPQGGTPVVQNNNPVFTNVPAGQHTITVRDLNTRCSVQTVTVEVTGASVVSFTYTTTAVSCNGGDDGTLLITLPGTQTQTDYQITIEGVTPFVTRNEVVNTTPKDFSFTGLKAGNYTVTVVSSRNCKAERVINIAEPAVLSITNVAVTRAYRCNASNHDQAALVKAVVAGGTQSYTYNFELFDGVTTITTGYTSSDVLSVTNSSTQTQTVIVYVRDAKGCMTDTRSNPLEIAPLKRITNISATKLVQIACGSDERVRFTISGGNNQGYLVYVTTGVATPSTHTLTAGINSVTVDFGAPGYYEVTVTDSATGCYATTSYTITPFDSMVIGGTQSKSVSCASGNDGVLRLEMTGYQGSYSYRVLQATPTVMVVIPPTTVAGEVAAVRKHDIVGLSAGSYIVEVTQTQWPSCTKSTTQVMISGPGAALVASATITNKIKCGGSDQTGSFAVNVAGGWGEYQYRIVSHAVYGNFTSTSVFDGLVSDTYTVAVKDKEGCVVTFTQQMAPPAPIAATITSTNVRCFNDADGTISVTTSGGSGNYSYELWEVGGSQIGSTQTGTTFAHLDARSYVVKIIDGMNCDIELPITITEPNELLVTAGISSERTCHTGATVSVTVTGGVGSYQYAMSTNGGALGSWQSSGVFSGLTAGEYEFVVKDGNGCESKKSNKVTIVDVAPLSLAMDITNAKVKCNGGNTAEIGFTPSGGMGNNVYTLHKGAPTNPAMTISATQIGTDKWAFTGLYTGTYYVVVKSNDCVYTTTTPIVIDEAPALRVVSETTNITCYGAKNGTISITVTGGTGNMQYAISPRFDRVVDRGYFDELRKGDYVVRVKDENNCFVDIPVKITEPDLLRVVIDQKTDEICYGAQDGSVSLTITGGTQTYSTSIDGGTTWTPNKTLYTGLASGTHTILVKDVNSCTTDIAVTIKEGVDLQATATVIYSCNSNRVKNDIRAGVRSSELGNTVFALDGGASQASSLFESVSSGTHTITVRHTNGCVQTVTVNVTHYDSLSATTQKSDISCYNNTDGVITLTVTGGTGSYTYTVANSTSTSYHEVRPGEIVYSGLSKGQYTINIKDDVIGCEIQRTVVIVEPPVLKAVVHKVVSETCYHSNNGGMEFEITGGRAPYSYELKDPQGNVAKSDTGLASGTVVSVTALAPGSYRLEYKDANGVCTQTDVIDVADAPSIAPTSVELKFNCSTTSTTFTTSYLYVTFPDDAAGKLQSDTVSYSVDGGTTIKPFVSFDGKYGSTGVIEEGSHTLIIYYKGKGSDEVCEELWGETVSVTRYPGLEIHNTTDLREINVVRVSVTGGNVFTRTGIPPYNVSFNDEAPVDGEFKYTLKPTDPTSRVENGRIFKKVLVKAIDANGCESILEIEREYMKSTPPNFFTPNGDGQNDTWDPDMYRSYPNLTADIYDRYGRYITTIKSGEVWDGRYKGKELPSGDYWYIWKTNEEGDDQSYTGNFTLYR